jgi:HTH-type transcriptional regulator / antitoxin HipB
MEESMTHSIEDVQQSAVEIGDDIKRARLLAGLTQRQLAEKIGMRQPAITRIERGTHIPTWVTLDKIADALGMRLRVELTGTPSAK